MSDKFSKYLAAFRKNHNTQRALLNMIENWKSNLDKGNKTGAAFVDLSKTFDTLDHFLLIAKLEAYGFDNLSLEFMKNYLTNRKQRCKFGNSFSVWRKITSGVPQGSVLGPLLFNIFINDIFLFAKNSTLCNCADDNAQFSCEKTFDQVINNLRTDFHTLKVWLFDNVLVFNPKKCHFMTRGNGNNLCDFSCDDIIIKNSLSDKIWMFCNRESMKNISKIQERHLRLMTNNYELSYEEVLDLTNEISPHQRCLNSLMTEVYKCLNGISPEIMNDTFAVPKHQYNT